MANDAPRRTDDTPDRDLREDDLRDNRVAGDERDWPGGSMGSEHESEVAGMRRERAKGTTSLDRDRTTQDDAPPAGSQPADERDASTRHLKNNEITDMDRQVGKGEGSLRTPREKDLHDELGRALDDAEKRRRDD